MNHAMVALASPMDGGTSVRVVLAKRLCHALKAAPRLAVRWKNGGTSSAAMVPEVLRPVAAVCLCFLVGSFRGRRQPDGTLYPTAQMHAAAGGPG
mmetsp:Transcript_27996/g.82993  ORF Transcript_27996/g.82993 Transcript_27996/m.82993 type:complete len:95 (-) Transcript_27996:126-410(-)